MRVFIKTCPWELLSIDRRREGGLKEKTADQSFREVYTVYTSSSVDCGGQILTMEKILLVCVSIRIQTALRSDGSPGCQTDDMNIKLCLSASQKISQLQKFSFSKNNSHDFTRLYMFCSISRCIVQLDACRSGWKLSVYRPRLMIKLGLKV